MVSEMVAVKVSNPSKVEVSDGVDESTHSKVIARFSLSFLAKFGGLPESQPYQRSDKMTLLEKPDLDDPLNGWQVDFWSQELV